MRDCLKQSHERPWQAVPLSALVLALLVLTACAPEDPKEPEAGPFEVRVDPTLQPGTGTVLGPGEREFAVGVMVNPAGQRDEIVEGQVIVKPRSDAERDAMLASLGATLLSDGRLPPAPPQLAAHARAIPEQGGFLLLEVNPGPDSVDPAAMAANARRLGLRGGYTVSSPATLALFALLLEEAANGRPVGPNLVEPAHICPAESSQEYPEDPSAPNPALVNEGYWNAFGEPLLSDPDIRLTEAWQLAEMYGVEPFSVPMAIIDRGLTDTDDFPHFGGWDLVSDDDDPTSTEIAFHGTLAMSIAAARRNDRFGSAGTGALAALPFAFRAANNTFATAQGIRTATAWGARITNLSRGTICEWACDVFGWASGKDAEFEAVEEAIEHNVIVLASAGNEGVNLDDVLVIPAEAGWVRHPISVGAIDVADKRALRTSEGHVIDSNFGWSVSIWAPGTCMPLTPRPTDTDFWNCTGEGTSAAAPYVAGVAAMMKAIVPDMYSSGAEDILQDTANTSADARVAMGYINALDALREAALRGGPFTPGPIPPAADEFEPNDFDHRAVLISPGRYCLNLGPGDDEDGFYFFLGDYRDMELTAEPMFDLGLVTAGFGAGRLPFTGELDPGSYYYIEASGEFGMPNLYCLTLTDNGAAAMTPDRFEVNDDLPGRAAITYPDSEIGGSWTVADLNFHVEGDPDCFEITLPDLPPGEIDSLSISAEPDSRGRDELFVITVYDDTGAEIDTAYNDIDLERIRRLVPSGRVQVCVGDTMNRRNYYTLEFAYRQRPIGVAPPPSGRVEFRVPDWIEAMDDMYFAAIPERAGGDEPFDRPYPGDPDVAEAVAAGETQRIPPEMLVLLWGEQRDLAIDFTFTAAAADDLDIRLRGQNGEVIATAQVTDVEEYGSSSTITKRVQTPGLSPGVYAFEIQGQSLLSFRASFPGEVIAE